VASSCKKHVLGSPVPDGDVNDPVLVLPYEDVRPVKHGYNSRGDLCQLS
jgi:hypothetical protein